MGNKGWAVLLALGGALVWGPGAVAADAPPGPRGCQKKAVDPCGCHRVNGVRHCHPNRKTSHCQALATEDVTPEPAEG